MPEYATITVQVTEHGDDLVGVDAELSARPLTDGAMLSYPAEPERLSVGTWKAGPNSDGSINLQIPIDTFQNPPWRFELRLKGGSQPVNIPLGTYYITESAALPSDLVNIDVTTVSTAVIETVAQYAADAQAAAATATELASFYTRYDTDPDGTLVLVTGTSPSDGGEPAGGGSFDDTAASSEFLGAVTF